MKGELRICIIARGFVFVGYLCHEANELVIRDAKNIRRWGTSDGILELAKGPTTATQIGKDAATLHLHPLQLVFSIEANEKAWSKVLSS